MARIYNKESYGVDYEGSAQSVGFNPIRAVDLSNIEKQRTQNELANLKLSERTLNRTQSIESAQLKAQQIGESAIMTADQAQKKANMSTISGLMKLSGTFSNAYFKGQELQQQTKQLNDEIDATFTQPLNGYSMGEVPSPVPQEQEQDFGSQQQAAGEATVEVAEGDSIVQSELMAPAIEAGISKNKSRSNAYTAAAGYEPFLATFMSQEGVTITRPDKSTFQLNAPESEADLAAVMSLATSAFAKEAGITGMDKAAIQRSLIPAVTTANNAFRRERSALIKKQRNEAALNKANGTAFDGLSGGTPDDPVKVFQNTFNSLVGVDGRSKGQAKIDAVKIMLANAVNIRVDSKVLDALSDHVIPGTGTKLGSGATGALIQAARRELTKGEQEDYRLEETTNNNAVKDLRQERAAALEAAGTDAKKIAEVEKSFADRAQEFGDAGRKLRSEIMKGGYQDSQQAEDALMIEAEAEQLTIEDIDALEGSYSPEFINKLKAKVDPDAIKAEATVKKYKTDINASANEVTKAINDKVQIDATGNVTSQAAAKLDIKMRLTADLRKFARLNPDATPAQIADAVRSFQEQYTKEIKDDQAARDKRADKNTEEPPYRYKSKILPSYETASTNKKKLTTTGRMFNDYRDLSTQQLRDAGFDNKDSNRANNINPSDDIFLKPSELKEASDLYVAGGADTVSPRIKELADIAGVSERVFLEQQYIAYGAPRDLKPSDVQRLQTGGLPDATTSNQTEKRALNIIGKYESDGAGGYDAVNQGGANGGHTVLGYSGPYQKLGNRALTDLSISEIMELQREDGRSWDSWFSSGKLHAVGRYQFIGSTLAGIVKQTGLDPNTKFSREVQDSLALYLLRASSNGIAQWVGPNKRALPDEREVVIAARTLSSPNATAAQVRRASKLFR